MMKRFQRFLMILACTLWLAGTVLAGGTEHFVTVRDDLFDPEVIEIENGDTVTWFTSEMNQNMHSVLADDGSFTSGDPEAHPWQFSHTFNTGDAEIFYHCVVHGAPGGIGMSGAVVVGDGIVEPFSINYGISGSWYSVLTDGQGFSIEVVPLQNLLVIYWFTYQVVKTDKGDITTQMWLQGAGEISGGSATVPLQRPSGGIFDHPQAPTFESWGSATFTFDSCGHGTVDYASDVDNVSGSFDITRITPDVQCQALEGLQ